MRRLAASGKKSIAAFSRDARLIALADDSTITVWALQGNAKSIVFPAAHGIRSLAFDPGGGVVASGSNDGTLALWDVQKPDRPAVQVRRHRHQISSVAFSADGTMLATGSWDNEVKLWSVAATEGQPTLNVIHTLVGHDDAVLSLVFRPDGKLIASGGWDNRILLWDCDSGRQLRELPATMVACFRSPSVRMAAGSHREARIAPRACGRSTPEGRSCNCPARATASRR